MKLFESQAIRAGEFEPGEADFPLPIADPAIPPMHRQCVFKGCSYRSPFMFAAGWILTLVFFITTLAIAFHGLRAQQALLSENAQLMQVLRERPVAPVIPPPPADVRAAPMEEPTTSTAPSPPPQKSRPPARRGTTAPKPSKEYTVPESEKWWNRP